jgi:secondary thiamine-phosphate synthase enzyme
MILEIKSQKPQQVIDITDQAAGHLPGGSGWTYVFVMHTTAALTTADLDPGTDEDLLDALAGMLPDKQWRHPHNPAHAPAHLLASIVGPGVTVPYKDGALQLGTWQRIILVEFDGSRQRRLQLDCIKTQAAGRE